MFLLFLITGALINRINGGWLTDLVYSNIKVKKFLTRIKLWEYEFRYVKIFGDIIFAICFGYILNCNFFGYIILGLSNFFGRCFGWGSYIKGLKDKKVYEEDFNIIINDFILTQTSNWKLRNIWALNIRGLIWSASIGLGLVFCSFFNNEIPFLGSLVFFVGLPMGYIYSFAFDICEKHSLPKFFQTYNLVSELKNRNNGIVVAELLFGGYFWSILYFLLWN